MIFEENSQIEDELYHHIKPNEFVKYMVKCGELDKISKNYSDNVCRLCRNSIAWIIHKLSNTYYLFDIEIVEGSFNGSDHAWLKVGNYYLDLTLAQFIECPEFAVCEIKKGNKLGYNPHQILPVDKWVAIQ